LKKEFQKAEKILIDIERGNESEKQKINLNLINKLLKIKFDMKKWEKKYGKLFDKKSIL
jgi:hypothetical protein